MAGLICWLEHNMGGAGGDRKRSKFPWLGAARYAVAALLAAVVAATVVTAIVMVLRPVELDLSVANGAVSVERPESLDSVLKYKITFRAYNPSGRAVIHFGGDNLVRLFDGASLELAAFTLPSFLVPQQAAHYVTWIGFLNASAVSALAGRLYDGESDEVLVQAVASLSFTIGGAKGVSSNKRGLNFTFECWPVSIGSYYEESNDDVSCSLGRNAAAIASLKQPICVGGCPPPYKPNNCPAPAKG